MLKPIIAILQQIAELLKVFADRSVKTGKGLGERGKKLGMRLKPPKLKSWQSMVWGSAAAGILSFFAVGALAIFATLGWQIFLLIGLYWFLKEAALALAPWILAALISALVYFNLRAIDSIPQSVAQFALVAFPLLAAAFIIVPSLQSEEGDRAVKIKNALLVAGTHLLLACWIQFHFVLQGWVREYPSFLAADLGSSAYATRVGWQPEKATTRGTAILDGIGNELKAQLNNKPWDALPEMTAPNVNKRIEEIKEVVGAVLTSPSENKLWKVQTDITPNGNSTIVYLEALWDGPRNRASRVDSAKLCDIQRGYSQSNNLAEPVAIVECQPARQTDPLPPREG